MAGLPHFKSALLVLAAAWAAFSCSRQPTALRLGYHEFPAYELLALGAEEGYFQSLQLRTVEYASATQSQRAFRNRAVDLVALTLDEALMLAQDMPEIRIVAVIDRSNGGDAVIGNTQARTLAVLRGKSVGVETTTLGAYMLSRALEHGGMTMNEVKVIHAEFDMHERLFKQGKVDAIVTYEPVRTRLLEAGAKILFDSSQIPGEIVDVLITRAEVAEAYPDAIAAIIHGWSRITGELRTDRSRFVNRVGERLGITSTEVENAFTLLPLAGAEENRHYFLGADATLPGQVRRLGETMAKAKLLSKIPDASAILDLEVARAAMRSH